AHRGRAAAGGRAPRARAARGPRGQGGGVMAAAAGLCGYFDDEAALLAAARAARAAGVAVADAYTPYAVHGLDEAMGLRRSRLPWVCFLAGLCGGALALSFELWA